MSSDALLQAESLQVRFEKFIAVQDVSLNLPASTLLGLIGPNGAGKTTLLRALAGLREPTRGTVTVLGERVVPGNTAALRMIGFTPDTPPMYEEMTVADFLHMIGIGYKLSRQTIEERTAFWLEKVWLTEKAQNKIRDLSRGMRQRLGLARTLIADPAVIFLDEPAAGLDPAGRVQFRQLLVDLRNMGKALIVSSHILSDMSEYCTHIGIMSDGRLVQFGTVAQISGTATADDGKCRYSIALAHPVADVVAQLSTIAEVGNISSEGERISLEYFAEPDQSAKLLAMMVRMNLPVAAFAPHRAGLEEAYLKAGIRQVD